jgi:cytochrome-b5 reductase
MQLIYFLYYLKILQAAYTNNDLTEFSLLFANRSSADILLKEELEKFGPKFNFKIFYTIDRAEEGWKESVGFINKDMISKSLPPPSNDTLILMCGPPIMCQDICMPILTELGHMKENIFDF